MRTNDRVTFVKQGNSRWDTELNQRVYDVDNPTKLPCHISSLGIDRSKELFGQYDSGTKVVRLVHRYTEPFEYVLLNDETTRYYLVSKRLNDSVFYVRGDST